MFCDDLSEFTHGESMLDIGCGNGRLWVLFSPRFKSILGIDPHASPDRRFIVPNATFIAGRFVDMDIDGKFDLVLFNESFYLMLNKDVVFRKALSLLSPDGTIIITDDSKRTEESIGEQTLKTNLFYDMRYLCELCSGEIIRVSETKEPNTRIFVVRRKA